MRVLETKETIEFLTYDKENQVIPSTVGFHIGQILPGGFGNKIDQEFTLAFGVFTIERHGSGEPMMVFRDRLPRSLHSVHHLSYNEVLIVTPLRSQNGRFELFYLNTDFHHEKIKKSFISVPYSVTALNKRHLIVALPDFDGTKVVKDDLTKRIPGCIARVDARENRVAIAYPNNLLICDENLTTLRHFDTHTGDEAVVDVKLSSDLLVAHIAFPDFVISFDLE